MRTRSPEAKKRVGRPSKKKKKKGEKRWEEPPRGGRAVACERTKHANRQTAGGQGWFSEVVVVVRADVVPQVGGATGHPEGGGTEEARAERPCVRRRRRSRRGGGRCAG